MNQPSCKPQRANYRPGFWRKALQLLLHDQVGILALIVIFIYAVIALGVTVGLWAVEWDTLQNLDGYSGMSGQYWLGTNFLGQDIFQRVIYGTKTAFKVGLIVSFFSVGIGAVLGALAGFFHKSFLDKAIIWLCTCLDSIPFYLFVAALAFALNQHDFTMYLAMISVMWTGTCKVVRSQALRLSQLDYITCAKALGAKNIRVVMTHILPNTVPLLIIESTIAFVIAIKTEAILSFLGLGLKDEMSWGMMLSEAGSEVVAGHYNNFFAASGFMFGLVMASNLFADAIQDALDPRIV